jgi:hydrogenase nickel incorporation protein HypA/HybF
MHELSVCQSLLDQVCRIAAEHHAAAVDKIFLQVGPLSGVEPGLLQNAFPFARANTVAADAELVISMLPIRVKCQTCAAESDATANKLICAECGDWHTQLLSGDELLLERVELRTEH